MDEPGPSLKHMVGEEEEKMEKTRPLPAQSLTKML